MLFGFVLVVSCTTRNPRVCADGVCPDPAFPFCDVDGSFAGNSNACIAVSCSPTEFAACRGDDSLICNEDGSSYEVVDCENGCDANTGCNQCTPGTSTCSGDSLTTCGANGSPASSEPCRLGCAETPIAHCVHIVPRYLAEACDAPATGSLIISSSAAFDTSLNAGCTGDVVVQTGGPEICVVRYESIAIEAGVSLAVTGPRAVALVADRDVSIAGFLDVSADGYQNGPGGGTLKSGAGGVTPNGSGGAGFKTTGGSGGSSTLNGGAGNAGSPLDPASLAVLVGGPTTVPDFGSGPLGAGGGAATLVSCRGTVEVSGEIHAGGGPGTGGGFILVGVLGGFGGGAGGNVVLQGANVVVTGKLFANGGSGGSGKPSNTSTGVPGYEGERSLIAVPGGIGTSGAGSGGDGGSGTSLPGHGGRVTISGATAGGGGGSVGYFQSYTPAGVIPTLTPSAASPAPQPNGTIPTR